jgi:hypothetical protein
MVLEYRTELQRSVITLHANTTEVMLLVQGNLRLFKYPYEDEQFHKSVDYIDYICNKLSRTSLMYVTSL